MDDGSQGLVVLLGIFLYLASNAPFETSWTTILFILTGKKLVHILIHLFKFKEQDATTTCGRFRIYSSLRNKMLPRHAEYFMYVNSNYCLHSRKVKNM